jgi:DNA-directed RNA polymerase sigma subunit (sigma70/sigma32)
MAGSSQRQLPDYDELVRLRTGSETSKGMTLAAIGERYGVSRQAVGRAIDRGRMHSQTNGAVTNSG